MNYTNNYHLPQWVKSDRIMMEDFNNAMSAIDSGIKSAQNAANSAKTAASAAQTAANAAKTTAQNAYSPSQKPYVIGSYTGDGGTQTIKLGFRPSFIIINGGRAIKDTGLSSMASSFLGITAGNAIQNRITLTATGFTVLPETLEHKIPYLNFKGYEYDYIAFK